MQTRADSLQDFITSRRGIKVLLGKLCFPIVRISDPIWKIYDQLKDSDLLNQLDEFTLEWIKNIEVCRDILNNIRSIIEETYEQFRPTHEKSSKCGIL